MRAEDWISVLDRLPEQNVDVLAFCSISGVSGFLVVHRFERNWIGPEAWIESVNDNIVTHWTPLVGPNGETPS